MGKFENEFFLFFLVSFFFISFSSFIFFTLLLFSFPRCARGSDTCVAR